ncbi:MAG: hypothetical protein ABIP71_07530 [Verrucomicrobiota bacterium]
MTDRENESAKRVENPRCEQILEVEEKQMDTMQSQNQNVNSSEEITADQNAVCQECGAFGAYKLGDQLLCMNCYQGKGSCCAEVSRDECDD